MDPVYDDRFEVFLRVDPDHRDRPDAGERTVATCSTYEEAREIRRGHHRSGHTCAIRFVGPAGGGD
jgi:hypothetical protein